VTDRPVHPTIASYRGDGGVLTVGGIPVDRLALRVGGTPFFAYDRAKITERVGELRRLLPAGVGLSYAIKANPMPAVVQHLAGLVDGFDEDSDPGMAAVVRAVNYAISEGFDGVQVAYEPGDVETVTLSD
jgi:diaminopimelate decarboxylase